MAHFPDFRFLMNASYPVDVTSIRASGTKSKRGKVNYTNLYNPDHQLAENVIDHDLPDHVIKTR